MAKKRKSNSNNSKSITVTTKEAPKVTMPHEQITVKETEEAAEIVCSCEPAPVQPLEQHYTSCDVAEFAPWRAIRCEWVPHLKKIVWYWMVDGEKTLVDEDGTIIPEYDCYCSPRELFSCKVCKVYRSKTTEAYKPKAELKVTGSSTTTTYIQKDRHYGEILEFPDGTTVMASSSHTRKIGAPLPDFALYLAQSWNPEVLCYYLPWYDFGLPAVDFKVARWAIEQAFESAKNIVVEVGCVGGHGRTGTVLACMATMAGVEAEEAVKWVRENYCEYAVESEDQEWFVLWFDAVRNDKEIPKQPEKVIPKKTTGSNPKCLRIDCNRNVSYYDDFYCWEHKKYEKDEKDDLKPEKYNEPLKPCYRKGCAINFSNKEQVYCMNHREEYKTLTKAEREEWDRVDEENFRETTKEILGEVLDEIKEEGVDKTIESDEGVKYPECPACGTQMVRCISDKTCICPTVGCVVMEALNDPEYLGWIFLDESNLEIGCERFGLYDSVTNLQKEKDDEAADESRREQDPNWDDTREGIQQHDDDDDWNNWGGWF